MKCNFKKTLVYLTFAVFAASVFIFTGCNEKTKGVYESQRTAGVMNSKLALNSFSDAPMADMEMAEQSSVYDNAGQQNAEYERKIIKTGNVTLEVKTLSDTAERITAWVKGLGGYVTDASSWESGANYTVRVPSACFDTAMTQAGEFGRVINRNVNSQDVSDNYYDLKSRLETKYILRDKLTGYLNQAKDIKDLLEIERQLSSVIEDIESTEGRLKRLSGQIDYSTIYIYMQFEHGKDESGIIFPDVKNFWNDFISNVIAFFWGLLKVLFYIVIFGIPLLALAALFFWLLFGRIGLLVKLFHKLKK